MGKKLEKAARMEHEVEHPLETFTLAVWEKNCYREERGSMIDQKKMEEIAKRLEIPDKAKVREISSMLENGASLGIEGEGKWPSEGPKDDSEYEFGARVADSLQTALKDGIIYGPLTREELPWSEFKFSPITVRLKPNGRARIIMDLSYPHGGKLGKGMVNWCALLTRGWRTTWSLSPSTWPGMSSGGGICTELVSWSSSSRWTGTWHTNMSLSAARTTHSRLWSLGGITLWRSVLHLGWEQPHDLPLACQPVEDLRGGGGRV